jgi:hypothetical protein
MSVRNSFFSIRRRQIGEIVMILKNKALTHTLTQDGLRVDFWIDVEGLHIRQFKDGEYESEVCFGPHMAKGIFRWFKMHRMVEHHNGWSPCRVDGCNCKEFQHEISTDSNELKILWRHDFYGMNFTSHTRESGQVIPASEILCRVVKNKHGLTIGQLWEGGMIIFNEKTGPKLDLDKIEKSSGVDY